MNVDAQINSMSGGLKDSNALMQDIIISMTLEREKETSDQIRVHFR